MPFDIQTALNALPSGVGEVVIPDGTYIINTPIAMPNGSSLRGTSLNGTILAGNVTNGDIITGAYSGYTRGHNVISNMTLRSLQGNVGGIHFVNNGGCTIKDIIFQGLTRNVHIDRGLGYSLINLKSETYGSNHGGSLLFEASDNVNYTQHVSILDYQSYFDTTSAPIILSRATNTVINNVLMHVPNNVGMMVNNDCQGVQVNNVSVVGCTDGLQVYAQGGHSPLGLDINNFNVDQGSGIGMWIGNGSDVHIHNSLITSCWQGIEIPTFSAGARISINKVDINSMTANGIIVDGGAKYFYIQDNVIAGCPSGAGIVISSGTSDYYIVVNNDTSQNNASGFVNASSGGTHKIVTPNL